MHENAAKKKERGKERKKMHCFFERDPQVKIDKNELNLKAARFKN